MISAKNREERYKYHREPEICTRGRPAQLILLNFTIKLQEKGAAFIKYR